MKKLNYLNIFLLGIVLFSCSEKKQNQEKVIFLEEKIASPEEHFKTSDYFSSLTYLPLETTDSSLLGSSPVMLIDNDRIFVGSTHRPCLVFDFKTGKFIRSIGLIDKGPQGYRSSKEMWINPINGVLYFPGWKNELVKYSVDGTYLGVQKLPANIGDAYSVSYLNKDTLVAFCESMMGPVTDRLVYFNEEGEVLKKISGTRRQDTITISDIAGVSIFTASKLGLSQGGIMLIKGNKAGVDRIVMRQQPVFGHWNGRSTFKDSYNDTLFRMDASGLIPILTLDMGKYRLGIQDRDNMEAWKDKGTINQTMESDRFLMFTYFFFPEEGILPYRGIYDKKTGEVRTAPYEAGFADDLNGFIKVNPPLENWANNLTVFLQPLQILNWFEEHPEEAEQLKPEIQKLKDLKEDDNPVLVVMRLK